MVSSSGSVASTALNMSAMDNAQQIQMAMLKKGKDMLEQNGQSVLQLVNSVPAPQPTGSLGSKIDVYA